MVADAIYDRPAFSVPEQLAIRISLSTRHNGHRYRFLDSANVSHTDLRPKLSVTAHFKYIIVDIA